MIPRRTPLKRSGIKRNKYGAVKTLFNGRLYDSGGEARCAAMLELRQKAGEIRNLQRQVSFDLVVNGVHITRYKADFTYDEMKITTCKTNGISATDGLGGVTTHGMISFCEWLPRVIDYKGLITPIYLMKKRLMKACLGIDVIELTAKDLK